jgi:hypothetical protein
LVALMTARVFWLRSPIAITSGFISLVGIALMPVSYRNIPFLFLFSIPTMRVYFSTSTQMRWHIPKKFTLGAIGVYVALVIGLSWNIITSDFYHRAHRNQDFGLELKDNVYCKSLSEILNNYPEPLKLFNHSSDGGFLQFSNPKIKPYNDSRFTDVELVTEYFNAINDPRVSWSLHRRHSFNGVLISFNYQEVAHFSIATDKSFTLGYADICHAFFVKVDSQVFHFLKQKPWQIYSGEDLAQPAYVDCLFRWAKSLKSYPNANLMAKIVDDLSQAPKIPAFLFLAFYDLARSQNLSDIRKKIRTWEDRLIFLDDPAIRSEVLQISLQDSH